MRIRTLSTALGATALVLVALTGCVPNNPGGATALKVAIADDSCDVSTASAGSGAVAFSITNGGSDVNEFEILAEDKLRIVGEKENITPGQKVTYVAELQPGTYYTACRFQQVGDPVGMAAFEVTGERIEATGSEKAQIRTAVQNYISYVRSQSEQLLPAVKTFTAAYAAGDDATARSLFASTRAYYERIEPTAEAFGDLDPKIDYREVDAVAEGLDWTGFHRIEKDLWPPAAGALNSDDSPADQDWTASTPDERATFAEGLVTDTQKLYDLVHAKDFSVSIADISNGAIGLLDEVASGKITGEEDWWSHTDLTDFAANVDGAKVAFDNVKEIAAGKSAAGAKLVRTIEAKFSALQKQLADYGSFDDGFASYDTVTDAQRKELSDSVNALAEPLSKLTHTVLGVAKS